MAVGNWMNPEITAYEQEHDLPKIIMPNYYATLLIAQHDIYCVLEEMIHTPCTTEEEFKEVHNIYCSIEEFMERLIAKEINSMKTKGE